MASSSHIRRLFLESYEQHYNRIFRYIRMRVSHEEEAKDLTSDIFMSALLRLETYDPTKGNLIQWLLGMAKNRLIDHWRKRKPLFVDEGILEQVSGDVNEGMIDHLDLQRVLADIPDEERALVTFHYVDGYSYEEIGVMIGTTAAAARQRTSRILRRLQSHYTTYEK